VRGTLLHFYGGGFTLGSIDMIDPIARRFARDLSMVVVTSNYRLAPENPFPAGFNDALFTARWVLDHAGELGGEDLPVVLSGESAGANLAAGVTLVLRSEPAKKGVAAQLLINPGLDLRASAADYPSHRADADPLLNGKLLEPMYQNYAGGHDRADPRISPITAVDLTGLPPAVIAVLTVDPLHDEGVAYAERLKDAHVQVELIEFDNLTHGFYTLTALVPAADLAVDEVLGRLRTVLSQA
jgi:acetyl esterase